jgi:predicted dehydrogenase
MRVGVIGTGFGQHMMAPALSATPGVEVIDVTSPRDLDAVRRLCARRDLDLVSVHSPPFLHVRDVELALDGGHAVLCDKPFGVGSRDATRMLHAAQTAGRVHLANLEFRREPWRLVARELICSGSIGTVESVDWHEHSSAWRGREAGWQFDADRGGGWLAASVSHTLDTLRWLLGELDVGSALLAARRPVRTDGPARPAEDTVEISGRFRPGGRYRIRACAVESRAVPARVVISGTRAALERTSDGRLVRHDETGTAPVEHAGSGPLRLGAVLADWCAQIRDAVESGVASGAPTLTDGVALAELLDQVRAAARWPSGPAPSP